MKDAIKYFRIEAQEHLEGLNAGLLHLECEPGDRETLKTLFRLAHTLKGSARMVALNDVGAVAHKMEDVLGVLREGGTATGETVITAMLEAVHVIEQMLSVLDDAAVPAPDTAPVINRLQGALETARAGAPEAAARRAAPPVKGDGPVAPAVPAAPTPAPALAPAPTPAPAALAPTVPAGPPRPEPEAAVAAPEPRPAPRPAGDKGMLRVDLVKIDHLANLTGELVISKIRLADHNARVQGLANDILRSIRAVNDVRAWFQSKEVRHLLHGTAQGEALATILQRTRTVALQEGFKGLLADAKAHAAQLDNLVSTLHEGVMDLRMLPASTLSTALHLVVRETGLHLGRPTRLEVEGEHIEIDKALLEGIKEPLAHLLRNAVDHGLESPEERARAGKPATGTIRLSFLRHGAMLHVSVADDGRGIDLERVRDKAVALGMLEPAEAESMRPSELFRYMMRPGLSTAERVTEVSGRGVGLDVVAAALKGLKGNVEFASAPGRGTTVHLRFPVNLSTLDGFLFVCGHRTYGVPLEAVVQIRHLQQVDRGICAQQPVIQVEGRSLPYVSMQRLLGADMDEPAADAVILHWAGDQVALGVDRVVGVRTMIVKPLVEHVGTLPWVSGITMLSSGRPAVVLDVEHLFMESSRLGGGEPRAPRGGAVAPAQAARRGPEQAPALTVLVVDDSLSARMMEKGMLDAGGYRVVLASDGAEALEKIAQGGIDLVLSDVEMPHMTGLELVRHLRGQGASQHLPVVILSSLGSEVDRKRGLDVGADAYLVKGELNQVSLLQTVARLIGNANG
ncbi:MAG: response regulator [Nitrospirae bacterium]|nr:response regulator [Nitrospirota bacterium]